MENNNGKGQNVLYLAVGVATLVVAIIGATFAYFSAAATAEGDTITGQTNNDLASALSLNVQRIVFEETGANSDNLVPTDLEPTVEGINAAVAKKCVGSGYTGCHIYKITASSTTDIANASIRLTSLTTDAADQESWKYVIYSNDGSSNDATSLVDGGASDFATFKSTYTDASLTFDMHNNSSLTAETPVYYYLLVYLANKEAIQNPEETNTDSGIGTYNGTVSMDVLGGKVVASFSASA